MATKINMPNIGEESLEVTEILVKQGDNIIVNQPLLVIEGDKSSMEIPAPYSGTITKIHTQIGDKVYTGSLILSLDLDNNHNLDPASHSANISQQYTTPKNNFLECKKTTQNIIHYDNNKKNHLKPTLLDHPLIHATPLIRHMARKFEIDLSKIKGSGRKGRILREDIENYLSILNKNIHYTHNETPISEQSFTKYPEINFNKFGTTTTIKLNKIQKISGANLKKNWSTIPHVTQFDTVDITNLENFRQQQNIEIEKKQISCKITILIFIIKAVAKALETFPRFNSSLSSDENTLILKKYINIGIAVDTAKGLLVPVLRDVNKKSITTLAQELSEMSQKARSDNKLTPFDIQGGSFTISNLGGIGGTAFTPIINSPEVAILGVSKSSIHPVWTGKKFTARLILPLSLSYDHRVIDGADGARFMNLLNKIISDIRLLSM